MLKSLKRILPLALGLTFYAHASHHEHSATESPANEGSLFQATFLGTYDYTTGHLTQLAEAIPADAYEWAPAEGVRSVEKTILHVAAANYMLGSKLGATLPAGVDPQALEAKSHDKDAAVKALKDSIAFSKSAVSELPASKLGEEVELFGMTLNKMAVVLIIGGHANEHLGQLIAYARANDIAPPWSR